MDSKARRTPVKGVHWANCIIVGCKGEPMHKRPFCKEHQAGWMGSGEYSRYKAAQDAYGLVSNFAWHVGQRAQADFADRIEAEERNRGNAG